MKITNAALCFIVGFIFMFSIKANAQSLDQEVKQNLESYLTNKIREYISVYPVKIDSVKVSKKTIQLYANVNLSYMIFDRKLVDTIYDDLMDLLSESYPKHRIELLSDGYKIEDYIIDERKERYANEVNRPLVTNLSKVYIPTKGLLNKHLAVWQSHGWHYDQRLTRWEWQRARLLQTVEDLYTQSYVLPYIVPMLENAGANVLLPRERDFSSHEIIIDNDGNRRQSVYAEIENGTNWEAGTTSGFAHKREFYIDTQNPFEEGTFRQIRTTKNAGEESLSEWIPDMPEKGNYAVYISYKSLDKSTEDALYTVHHLGGKSQFLVNQQMGGGTWIYLGHFSFDKGKNSQFKITLSNLSSKTGRIVTADAVKIGGGIGNIARMPHESGEVVDNIKSSDSIIDAVVKLPEIDYQPESSGRPRYTEGARYWLHWAGAPDSVYSYTKGKNDYTDDYQSRGLWVNYLAGGSTALPKRAGLNIPIDLAMAFHTDAGTTFNDSIIGTLGICMTYENGEKFENGKSRMPSRDLAAVIVDQIVGDIRAKHEPLWTQRHIWNRSYSEARIPQVPTMLLELLSHQNLADMRYGLDPHFRFTVSRAIYKGMLKFTAYQYKTDYVVQPLPVHSFSAVFVGDKQVSLKWEPTLDDLEPTATAKKYIVYTRLADGDFDNGILVDDTETNINIEKDKIYSFKVTAVNEGGESFPSEILSVAKNSEEKAVVLVVNGFDRVSAPFSFSTSDSIAGFVDNIDHGVPYINEYNYIGSQYEYRRQIPWMDDDAPGFGASNANYETSVLAGNTFDYPLIHGCSIFKAGNSFVSSSYKSIESGSIDMGDYQLVDLILGKQKQTKMGRGAFGTDYKTFTTAMQDKISIYTQNGGNIFVSGAYVASDLWNTESLSKKDHAFANKVLGYKWRVGQAAVRGRVKAVSSPFSAFSGDYTFHTELNADSYAAESPDAIEPAGKHSFTIFRYSENNLSAGVASVATTHRTCILGFPFEVVKTEAERDQLMYSVVNFLLDK